QSLHYRNPHPFPTRRSSDLKYVLSTSLEHSDWQNTLFLKSIDEMINLKASGEGEIRVYGSAAVVQALFKYELVDELRLLTFPIIDRKSTRLNSSHVKISYAV